MLTFERYVTDLAGLFILIDNIPQYQTDKNEYMHDDIGKYKVLDLPPKYAITVTFRHFHYLLQLKMFCLYVRRQLF